METEHFQKILDDETPSLDEEVREYLQGVLSDPECLKDLEALRETLRSFIEEEPAVERLMTELQRCTVTTADDTIRICSGTLGDESPDQPRRLDLGQNNTTAVAPVESQMEDLVSMVDNKGQLTNIRETKQTPTRVSRKDRRQQKQQQKKLQKRDKGESSSDESDDDQVEESWGGRGKGGRGEYAAASNSIKSNIHLSSVSILLDNGLDLLTGSPMDIVKGHRYGLIGRNGVGKSTLLRRLAQKAIPGLPRDMEIRLVQQQLDGSDESSLDALIRSDSRRSALLDEQSKVEACLESEDVSEEDLSRLVDRLESIAAELDRLEADTIEDRALEILRGLQFTDEMIGGPTKNLSGGWRMRLSLAQALLTSSDLVLFDECTNHLDLYGLEWLIHYLNSDTERTLIVVSHDTVFLDAICTDIVVLEHQRLTYHPGNYSEYRRQVQEKAARDAQILDAAERQKAAAQAFVQKQQSLANKKSADPNKQRQAKMIKEKKMERMGNYREDGKRYKNFSLATLSEKSLRIAQKVQVEADEPVINMRFPNPSWPPGISEHETLVRLEGFTFGYGDKLLLNNVTVGLGRQSKAALVGANGVGKSTLMQLIAGDLNPRDFNSKGSLRVHPNIRIGHVTQYAVESLEKYLDLTVVEYAEQELASSKVAAEVLRKASGNIRQYLGAFGLGGRHALQKVKFLSGGERMRLAFATILADEPHLLCLDESTNHVDLETLSSMSQALNAFEGCILMISHNQGFLSGFCNELWVLDKGRLTVRHSTESSFDDIFSEYRTSVIQRGNVMAHRQHRAEMAKRASKQTTGRQYGALM